MGKHHDRHLCRFSIEIIRHPLELLIPKIPEPSNLQVHDVDKADEMHASDIEAVPARALGVLAIVLAIELCVFIQQVVLPRNIVHVQDRKSTRLNSSHANISYAVFCLKKKKKKI